MFFMIAFLLVLMMTVGNPEMMEQKMEDHVEYEQVQEDLNEINELLDEINEEKNE